MLTYGLIGLAIGVIGTLIVMNNRVALAKEAQAKEAQASAALQAQLDKLATKV